MGSSSSSSSDRLERTPFKIALEQGSSGLADTEIIPPWPKRVIQNISTKHPRFYRRASRIVLYLRGPRPKQLLPDPEPLLDIDYVVRGTKIVWPIESTFVKITRPFTHPLLFILLATAYIIGLAFFIRAQSYLTPASSFIDCTSTYWLANYQCGLDGQDCTPFNNTSFDFRCPAKCSTVVLQNPRTVGNEQANLVPLIVGGGDELGTYRSDTFICAGAVQAGLISDSKGGCGTLSLIGNFTNFIPFTGHGLTSLGFETVFPSSFRFSDSTSLTSCADNRNAALAMNAMVTCIIVFLLRPKAIIQFWSLVCIGFWHIAIFSQPQSSPPNLSTIFSQFLPSLFISYGIWRVAVRFVMPYYSKAPLEFGVLYLGPFWVSVLANLTMDKIPIERLYAPDLHKRSGAITALVIIVIVIFVLAVNQLRVARKTGWFPHYLRWYIYGGLVVLVLSQLPGLELRIHHYIIALVLLPATAFPTWMSVLIQGFLLGLFLQGASAYGLDSILQTAAELQQDAVLGSDLPVFLTNSSVYNSSIPFVNQTIFWAALPSGWDGFSLLVDDVERYAGSALNFSLAAFNASLPHFFRLALTSGGTAGDFTNAAVLYPNGSWVDPAPGASY